MVEMDNTYWYSCFFPFKITFFAYLPILLKNSIDHDYYLASRCDVDHGFPLITIIR